MKKNIIIRIKSEYEFLTNVEKSIADLILDDPQQFITLTMAELSKKSGVSQGSINNFAKRFNESGFSDLKLKIAGCMSDYTQQPYTVIDKSEGIKAAMEFKIQETFTAFKNALELNDEAELETVAKRIMSAKKVEIYGIFQSGLVARDLCYGLIQLGIPATFVEDTLMTAVSASMLDEDCLVIAVSSSGQTKEIIDAVQIAKNNRVPIIAITANNNSLLAKMSDNVLLAAASGVSISDSTDEIRMTQLLLTDTLCSYIRSFIDLEGKNHYYKLKDILSSNSIKIKD